MMKHHMKNDQKMISWACDKNGCKEDNYRLIPEETTLYYDRCDYCHQLIHEPILIDIKGSFGSNDKPTSN